MTDRKSYDGVAKTLHWIIAILVLLMLTFGWSMEDMPLDERQQTMMGHSGLGTIVLVLMLVRWGWRLLRGAPAPVEMPAWQHKASVFVHWAFYGLLVLQPIFGILQAAYIDYEVLAFGVIDYSGLAVANEDMYTLFHRMHGLTGRILVLLVSVHIIAALVHHFYQKDATLRRMLPFSKVE